MQISKQLTCKREVQGGGAVHAPLRLIGAVGLTLHQVVIIRSEPELHGRTSVTASVNLGRVKGRLRTICSPSQTALGETNKMADGPR